MFPCDVWTSFSSYFRNRFVKKTHVLKTGLKPGLYHELDERILHGLFNELKDFVEVETAGRMRHSKAKYLFKKGRCPEAGLDHLRWASGLKFGENDLVSKKDSHYGKPTPQAISASKILELYYWWLDRPNRPDPMEESGFAEKNEDRTFKKLQSIEKKYSKDDEKMLIALIKIRKELWT